MFHRGKIHKYLGMDLNFTLDSVVQVSMIAYTSKVISDFPESITTSCTSPAGDHLFTIRTKVKFLLKEQAQAFHHTVAQLLFYASALNAIFRLPSHSSLPALNTPTKMTGKN